MVYNNLFFLLKNAYSKPIYLVLGIVFAICFMLIFMTLDELLFFSPILIFYLPDDAVIGFIISIITASLMGLVISLNIFMVKYSRIMLSKTTISGAILGTFSSICVGCSSLSFFFISTLGGIGLVFTNLLSEYQIHLRIFSIFLLIFALFFIQKKFTSNCIISTKNNQKFAR